ncbi:MAG: PHB depolymerase family esterase [Tepidisphaeraceae bacterium]|jgi:hypothetical protein
MIRRHTSWSVLCLVALAAVIARADDIQTGAQADVVWSERSPLSTLDAVAGRMGASPAGARNSGKEVEYDLKNETFELYVPRSYTGQDRWGLLVWISPGPGGQAPQDLYGLLDKHKLLWAGPNKAGNERIPWIRIGLALDAAHNMKAKYKIDENRVYIAGVSGGGRVSSMIGVAFPDVFQGGIYIIGTNFYRDVPTADGKYWRKTFGAPPAAIFTLARKRSRHVILEGETDMNRDQAKANFEQFKADGFQHVTYLEAPGVGHQRPSPEWMEKAILALEAPPPADLPIKPTTAPAAATKAADDGDEAAKLLRMAKVYLQNDMKPQARDRLEKITREFPSSPSAKEAKKLLEELPR